MRHLEGKLLHYYTICYAWFEIIILLSMVCGNN